MLKELFALAAEQGKIVGARVQPGTDTSFHVVIWIGPRMGERMEWSDEFPLTTDRMAAVDQMAERAVLACRDHAVSGEASPFAWGERTT